MTIKLGILGCGMIGQSFIEQSKRHKKFEVVAFCSKSERSLKKALELVPQAKPYLKKKDFFSDTNIEAVIVCTPHFQHADDAILSLLSGKHVLIEKPIATHKNELQRLLYTSLQVPNKMVTALPHGNYDFIKIARDIINSDAIGNITSLHSYLDVPGPPRSNWYYSKQAVGGATLDTLPYALSRLLMLLQRNISTAIGLKNQLIQHRLCGDGGTVNPEVDDNASLILLFPEGQQAIVRTNWNLANAEDFLIVHGRQGNIHIDVWRNTILLQSFKRVNYPSATKLKDHLYRIDAPNVHPEHLKLEVFFSQINNKISNLKEVSYCMEIIFSILLKNGELSVPLPFYSENQIMESLLFKDDYI